MSLLSEAMEACTMLDKKTVSDGYGGYEVTYTDGAQFKAAIVLDTCMQGWVAEQQGV